ncbi:hypothetical protein HO173_008939 [Letharia columbiana]|uniref:Rhodopsin domain-containing protein n=1 Tax=Letharia columbiana TaxID=112416 RepID=A0A8H6FQ80_9LECA|nr:uncharacterized protein HO173_008939 [Letharia columbiana]KAF6232725.1 hypothetical protein HO173_008939 [Letharia columbiana]
MASALPAAHISPARIGQPTFMGLAWGSVALTVLFFTFRIIVRLKVFGRLHADDGLVFFAWIVLLINTILWQFGQDALYENIAVSSGQLYPPPPGFAHAAEQYLRRSVAVIVFFYTGLWSVKFSFLVFFKRLGHNVRNQRIVWWLVLAITLASYVTCLGTIEYSCLASSFMYIETHCAMTSGPVRYQRETLRSNMILDVVTDALIILVPINLLWKVQLSFRKKFALGGIFCITVIIMVFAIIRAIVVSSYSQELDETWLYMWSSIEQAVSNLPFGHLGTLLLGAPYPTFFAKFCFDAARTVVSLTSSETLPNFTRIDYQLPHEGDAWPNVEDRFPKSRPPAVETSSKEIYNTRFWYDSAGPVFYNQVKRLLGTDYPYVLPYTAVESISQSIMDADFTTDAEKQAVSTKAKDIFGGLIVWAGGRVGYCWNGCGGDFFDLRVYLLRPTFIDFLSDLHISDLDHLQAYPTPSNLQISRPGQPPRVPNGLQLTQLRSRPPPEFTLHLQSTHLEPQPSPRVPDAFNKSDPRKTTQGKLLPLQAYQNTKSSTPPDARREPLQLTGRNDSRNNIPPTRNLHRKHAPRMPLPPRHHQARPAPRQTSLAPLPPGLRNHRAAYESAHQTGLHALHEAASAGQLPRQPGETEVRQAGGTDVLQVRGHGRVLQRAGLSAQEGGVFFLLCVSGAEEGGGGGGVYGPRGGNAGARRGWSGGHGEQKVVQGMLEGGDDVCECETGLKWWGNSRCVARSASSKLRNGVEMAIEAMSNGTRAGQHEMRDIIW